MNTKRSICYLLVAHLVLPVMSIIRDTKTWSDACSALPLETNSGGNAHGSIKSVAEVHSFGTACQSVLLMGPL